MTRHQKWYAENKDYFVKYREKNRQRHNERARQWRANNPEKARLSSLKYQLKLKLKILSKVKQ